MASITQPPAVPVSVLGLGAHPLLLPCDSGLLHPSLPPEPWPSLAIN